MNGGPTSCARKSGTCGSNKLLARLEGGVVDSGERVEKEMDM